jgi:hypothetical protein
MKGLVYLGGCALSPYHYTYLTALQHSKLLAKHEFLAFFFFVSF